MFAHQHNVRLISVAAERFPGSVRLVANPQGVA